MQRDSSLRLLLLFALLTGTCVCGSIECIADQRSLLLDLKHSFSFSSWKERQQLQSWKAGSDCCSWEGVTCDSDSGEIIKLDLSDRGISGNISSSLFELTSLQTLNLAYNEFRGLPQSGFEKLTNLTELNLSGAWLWGQVPIGISRLTKLVSLDLSRGFELINPDLPTLIRNLSNLRELYLDGVRMDNYGAYDGAWGRAISTSTPQLQFLSLTFCNLGGLTEDVFRLRNLTVLDLSGNVNLSGTLPDFSQESALVVLYLLETNISGILPSSLSNLKNLRSLAISIGSMTGSIPNSIGDLTHLVYLDLSINSFYGVIPDSIGNLSQLFYLSLRGNYLTSIPTSIGKLSQLSYLDLSRNSFSCPLPCSIGNLSQLDYVDLSASPLKLFLGPPSVPSPFNHQGSPLVPLAKVYILVLNNNGFTGPIPSSYARLRSLAYLDFSYNSISGSIPMGLFTLPALQSMDLSHNLLSGQLEEFSNPSTLLAYVDLSNNRLQGEIPKSMFQLAGLEVLFLQSNNFVGTVELDVFSSLENLTSMDLSYNSLQVKDVSDNYVHTFPKLGYLNLASCSLSQLPSFLRYQNLMQDLDISNNKIGGEIPEWIWNNGNLANLNLRENQLQGIIPMHVNEGCNLETVILSGNHLEGKLPRSLANCSSLEVLDLGNNYIVDSFPSWLGDSFNLRVLVLKSNGFYGPVELPESGENSNPFSKLQVLDLSSNRFDGILPSTLFKNLHIMTNTSGVASSYDQFSGFREDTVTITWEGQELSVVRILTKWYTSIDFSNNSFEGEIPDEIGGLQGLLLLNLSHNALTGVVPPAMGSLKQLERLDLSTNHLSGEIPQELVSLTFLSFLNLSDNDLAGRIPQGSQFSTFSSSSFQGNRGLCGIPLSKPCGNSIPAGETIPPPPPEPEHSSVSYEIGLALSVGLGFGIGFAMAIVLQNISWKFWKRQSSSHFSSLLGAN